MIIKSTPWNICIFTDIYNFNFSNGFSRSKFAKLFARIKLISIFSLELSIFKSPYHLVNILFINLIITYVYIIYNFIVFSNNINKNIKQNLNKNIK